MNSFFNENLLNESNFFNFLDSIIDGKIASVDYNEFLTYFNNDKELFRKTLHRLVRKLMKINKEIIYPLEVIPVPRYPFTKVPMIRWSSLQNASWQDKEVSRIKFICSKLGKLINVGFVLRNFVLIDIDTETNEFDGFLRRFCDVKTRRGYHIIRFLPDHEVIGFKLAKQQGTKITIASSKVKVELMSGSSYLGSYPLQSRYLEFKDGRLHIRAYKLLSNDITIALESADLTPISATLDDIHGILEELLSELNLKGHLNQLKLVKNVNELQTSPVNCKPHVTSRYNKNPLLVLQPFTYHQFKELCSKVAHKLPKCVQVTLFGQPIKGTRFYHMRLLLAILPFFVHIDDNTIMEIAKDFEERQVFEKTKPKRWSYYIKYFTGEHQGQIVPSLLGVPSEAWSCFFDLQYCKTCPLRESCLYAEPSKRRKIIVEYIANLISEVMG